MLDHFVDINKMVPLEDVAEPRYVVQCFRSTIYGPEFEWQKDFASEAIAWAFTRDQLPDLDHFYAVRRLASPGLKGDRK